MAEARPHPTVEARVAWFNCQAGVAGDMTLAALIDAGADADEVGRTLAGLGIDGYAVTFERVQRCGVGATWANVVTHSHDHDGDHQRPRCRRRGTRSRAPPAGAGDRRTPGAGGPPRSGAGAGARRVRPAGRGRRRHPRHRSRRRRAARSGCARLDHRRGRCLCGTRIARHHRDPVQPGRRRHRHGPQCPRADPQPGTGHRGPAPRRRRADRRPGDHARGDHPDRGGSHDDLGRAGSVPRHR